MKILHTSDLHLDSPLTTRLDSKKVRERKAELILSFKRLAESARREGADAFIIAGDLFDSERVGKRTLKNAIDIISAYPEITFFYLSGNHERDALTSSGAPLPDNLRLFGSDWTYFNLGSVNFIGKCDTDKEMFSSLRLNKDETNILVLHGELRDRSDGRGAIGIKDAEELDVDYIALGHYHSYSKTEVNHRCNAVYSGTPEGRGFDEAGDCGYVLIDASEGKITHKFVKSAMRTLRICEIDVTDVESDLALIFKIETMLKSVPREDLVRIKLVGTRELGRSYSAETILSSIAHSYYYVEIKDETRVRISPDDYKNDISLKGEFIRGVLADDSLSDKEKDAIISLGIEVLIEDGEV